MPDLQFAPFVCLFVLPILQVDQSDQDVYRPGSMFDEPTLVGRLIHAAFDTHVEMAAEDMRWLGKPPPDLMYAIARYLKLHKCRLRFFYEEFDRDGYGTLTEKQLRNLVLRVLPEATEEELRYFQVGVQSKRMDGCKLYTWMHTA